MKARREYTVEAARLAKAVDIAVMSLQLHPPAQRNEQQLAQFIDFYTEKKSTVLKPSAGFRRLTALDYQTHDVLTYFQEATGEAMEYFWKQVQLEALGYERIDKLRSILVKGRLSSRQEYEDVTDLLVVSEQSGRISIADKEKLSDLLGEYEQRHKSK